MTAEMSVQITLALYIAYIYINNPSAGIGRQDKLKLYWYKSWTFKSFFGYK